MEKNSSQNHLNQTGSEKDDDESTHHRRNKISVVIKDISFHCTEQNLYNFFNHVVPLPLITIKRNVHEQRSLLYGFADVPSLEVANELISTYDGQKFMGRIMRLELSGTNRTESQRNEIPKDSQVHFEYVSSGNSENRVTEEIVGAICQPFGDFEDIAIKRHTEIGTDGNIENQKGFGFVIFTQKASADSIIEKSPQLPNIHFDWDFSHKTQSVLSQNSQESPLEAASPRYPPNHSPLSSSSTGYTNFSNGYSSKNKTPPPHYSPPPQYAQPLPYPPLQQYQPNLINIPIPPQFSSNPPPLFYPQQGNSPMFHAPHSHPSIYLVPPPNSGYSPYVQIGNTNEWNSQSLSNYFPPSSSPRNLILLGQLANPQTSESFTYPVPVLQNPVIYPPNHHPSNNHPASPTDGSNRQNKKKKKKGSTAEKKNNMRDWSADF